MFNTKEDIMSMKDIFIQKRMLCIKILIVILLSSVFAVFCFHISKSSGVSTLQIDKKLSYICVTINKNDSLWSIAKKYEDRYDGSFDDFITEIKRCNGLKSNTIYAGRQIVIPVVIYNEKISTAVR